MRVTVRLFAAAREKVDVEEVAVELQEGATVGDLRELLTNQYPTLQTLLPHVLFAVDEEYAKEDLPLTDGCEIACIPPVSGG